MWHTGLVVLWHVGLSCIRDQTHVLCIGRQVLYHWSTREAPKIVWIRKLSTRNIALVSLQHKFPSNSWSKKRNLPPINLQFNSVTESCLNLCDPMNHSMSGLFVQLQLPEFTQTNVHWVCDAIQSSHPLSSPSLPAFNLSQHQGLLKWVSSSHQVAKVLEFQHQSFWWILRTDLL